jgi:hypothetical protein
MSVQGSLYSHYEVVTPEKQMHFEGLISDQEIAKLYQHRAGIEEVSIERVRFFDRDIQEGCFISNLAQCTCLRVLTISGTYFTKSLLPLSTITTIKSFSFSHSGLLKEAQSTLYQFVEAQQELEQLTLGRVALDDALLAGITHRLEHLVLQDCFIGSLSVVRKILSLSMLQKITFQNCRIAPHLDLSEVSELPCLKGVNNLY